MNHAAYIASDLWAGRKVQYYAKHAKRCAACGSVEKTHLHHLTYEHAFEGKEPDRDLMPLCERCHSDVHKLQRVTPGMTILGATRQHVASYKRRTKVTRLPKVTTAEAARKRKSKRPKPVRSVALSSEPKPKLKPSGLTHFDTPIQPSASRPRKRTFPLAHMVEAARRLST